MQKPKILVIEDTDAVREVLTRQLEALGTEVTALADGDTVKRELDRTMFDLVIADLHLPDCSGVDIARFARAKTCNVVLLSGDNVIKSAPHLRHAGFDAILQKPVTIDQLERLLDQFGLRHNILSPLTEKSSGQDYDQTGSIDLVSLADQMGDLDETCRVMLARFPEMMKPLVITIQTAAREKDYHLLEETAHSLKGAARSIGAIPFGLLCEEMQNKASSNIISETSVKDLEQEFLKLETAIFALCTSECC